jgi:hypothetical protein
MLGQIPAGADLWMQADERRQVLAFTAMSAILLSAHLIVAILAVGPIAFAASMFPRYSRDNEARPIAGVRYRICQTYATVGVAVPLLGIAAAVSMGVLGQAWALVSIALTAAAAVVVVASILSGQHTALEGNPVTRPAMTTGIFNLPWVAVTILMIVRPGSATGG